MLLRGYSHLNSLMPSLQLTMEIESVNAIPFLDVLIIRKETTLASNATDHVSHAHNHETTGKMAVS
jgi:hypothetical protein